MDAHTITLNYPRNHRMQTCLTTFLKDFAEKCLTNSFASIALSHVERDLCSLSISTSIRPLT